MSNPTRSLGCAGLALIALLASDTAIMTAGPLPGAEGKRLSAQDAPRRNFQDEERMFMEARRALNREEFDRAAELFVALRTRYPVNNAYGYGRFVPDSYYWEAFGRYRQGDLDEARMLLDLVQVYGEAQSRGRLYTDVRELRLRIHRQLAEEGDPRAAEEVLRDAEAILLPDTAAIREMQRRAEAQQEEMMAQQEEMMAQQEEMMVQWEAELARTQEQWQRQLEGMRMRAQADSTGLPNIWAQAARQLRENEAALADILAHADTAVAEAHFRELLSDALRHQRGMESAIEGIVRPPEGGWPTGYMPDRISPANERNMSLLYQRYLEAGPEERLQADRAFDVIRRGQSALVAPWPVEELDLPGCEDALVQQEALTSLLRLETDKMPALRNVLGRDDVCSQHLQYQAVSWLAAEGTAEAQSLLTEVATSHPDTRTRRWAISSLAGFHTPEVAQALVDILRESDDREIQQAALVGLGDHKHDQATEALTEFAVDDSKPEELREQAAMLIAHSVTADSVGTVFKRLDSEDIQLGFLEALAERVRTGELRVSGLFPLVEDPNHSDEMRVSLLQVWSMQPAINLDLDALDHFYRDLESAELRDQILYSLYLKARSDEEKAPGVTDKVIDKMIELARKETDPEVRKRAIYWLGRTGSERAAAFLMEVLKERSGQPPGEGTERRHPRSLRPGP